MQYAIVGRVRKPQGIRGHVSVEVITDDPATVFAPGARVFAGTPGGDIAHNPGDKANPESRQPLLVEDATPFKGGLIVKFDAIPDRSAAELWRQRYLLIPVSELTPPADNEVFVHELVGMTVVGRDGTVLGEVRGFYELPQGLTLDVLTPRGDVLLPYRPTVIDEVDRDARRITVDVGNGLFD